jgi:hypothetical protein
LIKTEDSIGEYERNIKALTAAAKENARIEDENRAIRALNAFNKAEVERQNKEVDAFNADALDKMAAQEAEAEKILAYNTAINEENEKAKAEAEAKNKVAADYNASLADKNAALLKAAQKAVKPDTPETYNVIGRDGNAVRNFKSRKEAEKYAQDNGYEVDGSAHDAGTIINTLTADLKAKGLSDSEINSALYGGAGARSAAAEKALVDRLGRGGQFAGSVERAGEKVSASDAVMQQVIAGVHNKTPFTQGELLKALGAGTLSDKEAAALHSAYKNAFDRIQTFNVAGNQGVGGFLEGFTAQLGDKNVTAADLNKWIDKWNADSTAKGKKSHAVSETRPDGSIINRWYNDADYAACWHRQRRRRQRREKPKGTGKTTSRTTPQSITPR